MVQGWGREGWPWEAGPRLILGRLVLWQIRWLILGRPVLGRLVLWLIRWLILGRGGQRC